MVIHEFTITLVNVKTGAREVFDFIANSDNYFEAWKEATDFASEKLKALFPQYTHIASIEN